MLKKISQLYKKLGPAFIVLESDNDQGAISTYARGITSESYKGNFR